MKLADMVVGDRYVLAIDSLLGQVSQADTQWMPDLEAMTVATYLGPTDAAPRRPRQARLRAAHVTPTPWLLWGPARHMKNAGDEQVIPTALVSASEREYAQVRQSQQDVINRWRATVLPGLREEAVRAAQIASEQCGVPIAGGVFAPPLAPTLMRTFVLHTHRQHLPAVRRCVGGDLTRYVASDADLQSWETGNHAIVVERTDTVILPARYSYGLVRS